MNGYLSGWVFSGQKIKKLEFLYIKPESKKCEEPKNQVPDEAFDN